MRKHIANWPALRACKLTVIAQKCQIGKFDDTGYGCYKYILDETRAGRVMQARLRSFDQESTPYQLLLLLKPVYNAVNAYNIYYIS